MIKTKHTPAITKPGLFYTFFGSWSLWIASAMCLACSLLARRLTMNVIRGFLAPVMVAPQRGLNSAGPRSGTQRESFSWGNTRLVFALVHNWRAEKQSGLTHKYWIYPPSLKILLKVVTGAPEILRRSKSLPYAHRVCMFLLHFRPFQAISSIWFWVGPLCFWALHITISTGPCLLYAHIM